MIGFYWYFGYNFLQSQRYRYFRTLHFTVAQAQGFSVSSSRPLAMGLNTETSTSAHYEDFLSLLL
jgi:hypothetical protein